MLLLSLDEETVKHNMITERRKIKIYFIYMLNGRIKQQILLYLKTVTDKFLLNKR